MRLGIKVLQIGSTLNSFKQVTQVSIAPGENVNLLVQLVDLDQAGQRYIPAAGATMKITIPRMTQVNAAPQNTRTITDPTISRPAAPAFGADDRSIWMVPLTSEDTASMVSNSIQVELTEGSNKKIAFLNQAIRMISGQDQ